MSIGFFKAIMGIIVSPISTAFVGVRLAPTARIPKAKDTKVKGYGMASNTYGYIVAYVYFKVVIFITKSCF